MATAVDVVTDLSEPIMFFDPFPRYAELRRTAPVSRVRSQLAPKDSYMLTRYEDVMLVHTDKLFSSDHSKTRGTLVSRMMPRMFKLLMDSMVFKDEPDHTRLRHLVNRAFTPKMVARMEQDMERIVTELLDKMVAGEV